MTENEHMSEKQQTVCDPFDYLADTFWASLPEESANELADFKKRVLKGIKSAVDSMVGYESTPADSRLQNAGGTPEEWAEEAAQAEDPPDPAWMPAPIEKTAAVVIGAGVIGCAVAWRLGQAGMRVVVVERGR